MTRSPRLAGVLASAFLLLHLPFLPASLEDLDSINFALGLRDFDVARHQPHPPGYPVYMAAAHAAHAVVADEARALSLVAIVAGALAAPALLSWFGLLRAGTDVSLVPAAATLLVLTAPLFWVTAARPLSDVPGLAAAVAIQAMIAGARTTRAFTRAAFAAGVCAGIRSQVVWLTVPLLALEIARRRGRGLAGAAGAYVAGALIWAIPLLALSGGPAEYWRALVNQGAEDLSGVVMLWTTPTPRVFVMALENTFLAPWGLVPLALIVLAGAAGGAVLLLWRREPATLTLAAAFGPYLLFDLLFQETVTTRYALPLVVPVAYLAARAAHAVSRRAGFALAALVSLACLGVSLYMAASYARVEAPAFRLLADMRGAAAARPDAPVLAMHRREQLDMRRPIAWVGADMTAAPRRLGSPPKHEWLEVVKYWNAGGRAPVWFVADPLRSDLALIDHRHQTRTYRWPIDLSTVLGGVRPNEMDWHVYDAPGWYLGEGWAVTPETAGVSREDGRDPRRGPIQAWVRRHASATTLMLGGRNLSGAQAAVRVTLDDRAIHQAAAAPGFFLWMLSLPEGALRGGGDFAPLVVVAAPATGAEAAGADVAFEQFDAAPAGEMVFGFGEGWHEQEINPATGVSWRWSSDRAAIRLRGASGRLALEIGGEVEAAPGSHVTIRVDGQIVAEHDVGQRFNLSVGLPVQLAAGDEVVIRIDSSESYVPAERSSRSGDRRRLGLKVHSLRFTKAS